LLHHLDEVCQLLVSPIVQVCQNQEVSDLLRAAVAHATAVTVSVEHNQIQSDFRLHITSDHKRALKWSPDVTTISQIY
jgi:hypothetical protein